MGKENRKQTMTTQFINKRIKFLREKQNLSQEELAKRFDFNDRQTVSAIENGKRLVSAEDMVKATKIFGVSLDYLTDPFLLIGEGKFSWRQTNVKVIRLDEYEKKAGRWIAAYRKLTSHKKQPLMRPNLNNLSRSSSYEDAAEAGERFVSEFKLGKIPAKKLAEVMNKELGILVLRVNTFKGISGAACRLSEFDTVLINRKEPVWRRNFDLAHELFHLLTWNTMPPDRLEEATEISEKREEKLANSFASAVLMPSASLGKRNQWENLKGQELINKINETATRLMVSVSALKWRLKNLGMINQNQLQEINRVKKNNKTKIKNTSEPLFSKPFMKVIGKAINEGRISVRRTVNLLDLTIEDLKKLMNIYNIDCPIEL